MDGDDTESGRPKTFSESLDYYGKEAEADPEGGRYANAIWNAIKRAGFTAENVPEPDEGGWIILAEKQREFFDLRVDAICPRNEQHWWWTVQVSYTRSCVFGHPRISVPREFKRLCVAVDRAVREAGEVQNVHWMREQEFESWARL